MAAIALLHIFADDGVVAATQTWWKLKVQGRVVDLVNLYWHNLLQLFYAALNLNGFCWLVAEALNKVFYVGNLFLLVLIGTKLLLTTLCSKLHIFVILDLIVGNPSAGYLQCSVGDVVYERPVVAHKHNSLGALLEDAFQPLNALNVEVVGGLVQKQHVRTAQQDLCQLYTHAPTAAELGGGAVKVGTFKAQSCECAFHFCLIVVGPHHHVAFVLGGKLLYQLHVAVALIIGSLRQFFVQLVHTFLHLAYVGKRFFYLLPHGGVVLQVHNLRQIANGRVVWNGHVA